MNIISIVSMKGGVGRSMLTASLATAMARRLGGNRVATIDLDPADMLRWHFGQEAQDSSATDLATSAPTADVPARFESSTGVVCLRAAPAPDDFEGSGSGNSQWLREQAEAGGLAEDAIVLVDTPAVSTAGQRHALANCDLALAIVMPDAASFATLAAQEGNVAVAPGRDRCRYVINRYDPRDPLAHDVLRTFEDQLAERLAPVLVHNDEGVREALALQQTSLTHDPHSQASHDIDQLAQWLLKTIEEDLDP